MVMRQVMDGSGKELQSVAKAAQDICVGGKQERQQGIAKGCGGVCIAADDDDSSNEFGVIYPAEVSPWSLRVSTRTPLDESTLRIPLPSSANSRFIRAPSVPSGLSGFSGLSPSSTGELAKSGFRKAFLNASAMIAASAPENNGPLSPDVVDAPSGEITLGGPWPCDELVCRPTAAAASSGDPGELPMCAIIGDAEPIELRFDSFRLRTRRIMKKPRTHVVATARNPSTTITAMAQ